MEAGAGHALSATHIPLKLYSFAINLTGSVDGDYKPKRTEKWTS